jgi:predicted ATPase
MTGRQLERIEVAGFTSIRFATVELGRLNVLVGANGAGKSNFIHALAMLGRIVDNELNLFVGLNGGAGALLNSSRAEPYIKLRLAAQENSYEATLVPAANDELIFDNEQTFFHRGDHAEPWRDLLGRGHRETLLHNVVEQQTGKSVARQMVDLLRGCRVFHFHDTSVDAPVKRYVPKADNLTLRDNAANLAAVLYALKYGEPSAYRRIVGAIRQVAPFFRDFALEPENDRILLRWREGDSDAVFSANQMSDGTLRFVCLATLLLQPALPALVVLDEPELGLHPYAIIQLAGLLRQASVRSQVLIATQSVTLMNQFEVDDLIVVERHDGESQFSRPDRDKLSEWLNEYSLGELWEKNLIGGRPGDVGTNG